MQGIYFPYCLPSAAKDKHILISEQEFIKQFDNTYLWEHGLCFQKTILVFIYFQEEDSADRLNDRSSFEIEISAKDCTSIKTVRSGGENFRQKNWTNVFANTFNDVLPRCALTFQ